MAYLEDRLALIETVPATFITSVDALREELFAEMSKVLLGMDTVDGKLLVSARNEQEIERLIASMGDFLFGEEAQYLLALQDLIVQINSAATLADNFFGVARSEKWTTVLRSQQFKTAKIFDREVISAELGTLIRNTITDLVMSESEVVNASIFLKDFITGTPGIDGRLTRYAKTWANTAYANAERQYVTTVGNDLGVENWRYQGGLVKDSRPFCKQRVGQVFTADEVRSWASLDWAGKIQGTDEVTIFSALGGYNCLHVLMPVQE